MPKREIKQSPRYTGHIRLRSDGRWEGQYYDAFGERKSVYGDSENDVRIKINIIYAKLIGKPFRADPDETISMFFYRWLACTVDPTVRSGTYVSYEGYIRNHITPYMGDKKMKVLTAHMCREFYTFLATEGRKDGKPGGLSNKTVLNIRNMMSTALTSACSDGQLDKNPILGIKLPPSDSPEVRFFDDEETDQFVEFCLHIEHPIAKAILILLDSGMRRGELLGLQLNRLYLNDRRIHISKTLTRMYHPNKNCPIKYVKVDLWASPENKTGLYLGPVKTKKGVRDIFLTDRAYDAIVWLKNYQQRLRGTYCPECPEPFNPFNFLLLTERGRPYDPKCFEEWYNKFAKQAGLENANIHAARHTFATRALRRSKDAVTVSSLLERF